MSSETISLKELFEKDPRSLTDDERHIIIQTLRERREKWLVEKKPAQSKKLLGLKLEDLDLSSLKETK